MADSRKKVISPNSSLGKGNVDVTALHYVVSLSQSVVPRWDTHGALALLVDHVSKETLQRTRTRYIFVLIMTTTLATLPNAS